MAEWVSIMSGLLKLKSVFSPTNTKFQENQSDLTTFNSKFDDGLNVPIKSNLLNLDGKFDDGLNVPIKSNLLNLDSKFDDGLNVPIQTNLLDGSFDLYLMITYKVLLHCIHKINHKINLILNLIIMKVH